MPGMYHIKIRGARIYICTNQGEYRLFNVAEPTPGPGQRVQKKAPGCLGLGHPCEGRGGCPYFARRSGLSGRPTRGI